MYIALKWLICMALAMWALLCSVDYFKTKVQISEINTQSYTVPVYKKSNVSLKNKLINNKTKLKFSKESMINSMYLHYLLLLTGAYMISILNRKYDIVLFTKMKIKYISLKLYEHQGKTDIFKNTAINISGVAILKCVKLAKLMKAKFMKIIYSLCQSPLLPHPNINFELINKMRILNQERKNLGRLLIAALDESKYIKTKYQLETMAKSRLNQYVEDSHKQIKENRSKYISFQQLYLIAHQENIFLKSRVRKLAKEKEDAERNLVKLVNKIWLSKNSELKNFCSQLIVETKNNLINTDVKKEINKFVQKSNLGHSQNVANQPCEQDTSNGDCVVNESQKPIDISEILDEEYVISLIKNGPEHRSFSRECVWTVKDKDGIIEKLYEYDTNFNKGDSVRRIREYSVYYDKECLLDFSNNNACRNMDRTANLPNESTPCFNKNHRFLTESRAFQQFLQNYNYFDLYRPKPLAIAQ